MVRIARAKTSISSCQRPLSSVIVNTSLSHVKACNRARITMGEMSAPCPDCGADVSIDIGQAVVADNRLLWSKSISCGACGLATEEDGDGFPPESLRQSLLDSGGIWRALLVTSSDRQIAVMMLRKILGLDLNAAAVLLRSSSAELWRGTRVECDWLANHMRGCGVETTVRQA